MESGSSQSNEDSGGIFTCSICGIEEFYHYYGKTPPFSKNIMFAEDSYILKDPFSPPKLKEFLLLGSKCNSCQKCVCQYQSCSIFYSKRYCILCASANLAHFPKPVQEKIKKMHTIN